MLHLISELLNRICGYLHLNIWFSPETSLIAIQHYFVKRFRAGYETSIYPNLWLRVAQLGHSDITEQFPRAILPQHTRIERLQSMNGQQEIWYVHTRSLSDLSFFENESVNKHGFSVTVFLCVHKPRSGIVFRVTWIYRGPRLLRRGPGYAKRMKIHFF